MIARFRETYEAVAGIVLVADSPKQAARHTMRTIKKCGARKLICAELSPDLTAALTAEFDKSKLSVIKLSDNRQSLPWQINEAAVGISAAEFGIVETGTIVEVSIDDVSRLISTLPDVHIAFLPAAELVAGLADAAPRLRELYRKHPGSCNISFISGPSRTADIEMKLFLGVHGPRASYVIICDW